jgi:dienelactone hydrolase
MKTFIYGLLLLTYLIAPFMAISQVDKKVSLTEENITYELNGTVMNGFVVYDQNVKAKRPAVLVVPEWWGLNDYAKSRARQLASLGYIAMAVDMYGEGKIALNPQQAQELATPFYKDPTLSKNRLDAAINKIKEYKQTDITRIAAIGYCFGGSVVLNSAKLGADLKGVVSFHGGLAGVPANKDLLKAKILVCHGDADKFVPQKDITAFKHAMDSIGADYTFKSYAEATHAFTNPDATRIGKQFDMPIAYNEAADRDSWKDMQNFLDRLFLKK